MLYLDPKPSDIILDVGCSEGFMLSHFLKANFIVGLEISKASLLIAKEKVRAPDVDFVCADAKNLPFRASSFNKVTLLEVLEHLSGEEQKKFVNEIDRILSKGRGNLILTVPYKERTIYTRCIHCGKLTPLWGHLSSMDEEKVSYLLPYHYKLVAKCHFPNVGLISLANIFSYLPLRLWLLLNNILGLYRKGYWVLLKYLKE